MRAIITVTLKPGVLDPAARAIEAATAALGIAGVSEVHQGRHIEVTVAGDEAAARATVERMCRELLANPVIERYAYRLEPA